MLKVILPALCVLATAASPLAAVELTATSIAGRWEGKGYAGDSSATLTFDIVACGADWCGIRVAANDTCGATALRIGPGSVEEGSARFEGTLQLAAGTEPYTVHATVFPPEEDKPLEMQLIGDTGGQLRIYRRSFPFEAALVRLKDAVCHAPQTVSALD